MYVEKRGGKYRFVQSVPMPDRSSKRVSVTMDKNTPATRMEALRILNQKAERLTSGTDDIRLQAVLNDYYEWQYRTLRESTVKRNKGVLNAFARLIGENVRITDIKARTVNKCLLKANKPTTWNNEVIKRFKAFCRWCYKNDILPDTSTADKLEYFKDEISHAEKIQDKYLSKQELTDVLKAMEEEKWKLLTEFLALSGLRIGEASALLPEDFTPEGISITKTYNQVVKQTTQPKTFTSRRAVHVQPELKETIRKINLYWNKERLKHPELKKNPYWFPGVSMDDCYEGHLSVRAYDAYLKQITKEVTGKALTAHALRHTHVSLLAEQGVDLDGIALRLGHGHNSRITRQIYLHITDNAKKRYNDMVDKISLLG